MAKKTELNDFGKWLRQALFVRDITYTEFAAMLGTSRPYLWTIMHQRDGKQITGAKWQLLIFDALKRFDGTEGKIEDGKSVTNSAN